MENRRRTPHEVHRLHWSPVMALALLVILGVIVAVIP